MPRPARVKSEGDAFYHIWNRVAGFVDWRPFEEPEARDHLLRLLFFHLKGCYCKVASVVIMGNHYHLVLWLEKFRKLTRAELEERARYFYGRRWRSETSRWTEARWMRFNHRLFDVSRIMQILQSEYARWYNRNHERQGRFWGDRFKSNLALDLGTAQNFVYYNELNPIRAGLVGRPEDWPASSARLRYSGKDDALMSLEELFPESSAHKAFEYYRSRLLYYGWQPGREGQASISDQVLRTEKLRGFRRPGAYMKRHRCFRDGVALGTEEAVRGLIKTHQQKLGYVRPRSPVIQLGGALYSVTKPRSRSAQKTTGRDSGR